MKSNTNSVHSGSHMFAPLLSDKGFTLVEVLVSTLVLVVSIITIYIGIVYAESQVTNNYRDRVASLLASGELELQHYYFVNRGGFNLHHGTDVLIQDLPRNRRLMGRMTVDTRQENDNNVAGVALKITVLEVKVEWRDPNTNKLRFIKMREDYY